MKLFIIRHAESANNRLVSANGYNAYMENRVEDPPLTELGELQAERLGEHVADNAHPESRQDKQPLQPYSGYGFTHLYCSPMFRAMQTTEPISRTTGLTPEIWVDIHEHGGIFLGNPRTSENLRTMPGMTRAQIEMRFPGYVIPDAITERGWYHREYEDMPACYARATRVSRRLRNRAQESQSGDEEAIAMVAHGTFIDSLLKAFLNQLPDSQLFYQHYNTAITRIDFMEDGTLILRYLNRTQHLSPENFSV